MPDPTNAALDDLPLTSLQSMRVTLLRNIRRGRELGSRVLLGDWNDQLSVVDAEILQRTARFAHMAGQPWTAAEDLRLQRLARAGETIECIASTLGRTCAGISARGERFEINFGDDGRSLAALERVS